MESSDRPDDPTRCLLLLPMRCGRTRTRAAGSTDEPAFYSMTCHIGFGKVTGALPNGRAGGTRLSNGLAPVDGSERLGPTAVLRSAAFLDSRKWTNCHALNLKFDKHIVRGGDGAQRLGEPLQTLFRPRRDAGSGQHTRCQTLKAAKKDPLSFLGIVVRVAGYCAYFNDLQPDVQDEIIERTAIGSAEPLIFSLQHFCLHDGPGMPSLVFSKVVPYAVSGARTSNPGR